MKFILRIWEGQYEIYIENINEGLGLLELADTSLILINPSPSNVNHVTK